MDPNAMDPASSHLKPGTRAEFMTLAGDTFERLFLMGTDSLGRDIWSRAAYGTRVSLAVGVAVAILSVLFGTAIGLIAGYFRRLDGPIMRVMDGMMAIPSILFAIALVAVWQPSVLTVVLAIVVPEMPRVARLVRSVVLSVREEPYVEAAIALDTPTPTLMLRHILPNALAPLVVHATFVCAAAMLVEAAMSFLGIGLPPHIPTWGNIMADGRAHFNAHPYVVLLPGALLTLAGILLGVAAFSMLVFTSAPWLQAHFGITLHLAQPTALQWLLLLALWLAGWLASLLPGWRAYRLSLADALSPRL